MMLSAPRKMSAPVTTTLSSLGTDLGSGGVCMLFGDEVNDGDDDDGERAAAGEADQPDLPAVHIDTEFGENPDIDEVDAHVRHVMQRALDGLAEERRFPVIG